MQFFFEFFHVFLCLVLILIILLQPGKDSADIFGGGQGGNRMYGSRSQQSPLGRVTTIVAVLFMITSITLALYSSKRAQAKSEILDKVEEMEQELSKNKLEFQVQKLYTIQWDSLLETKPSVQQQAGIAEWTKSWEGGQQQKNMSRTCRQDCIRYRNEKKPEKIKPFWNAASEANPQCAAAMKAENWNEFEKCYPDLLKSCTASCVSAPSSSDQPEKKQEKK